MALNTISSNDLESVFNLFTDSGTLFVIPSFQRPYAWEKEQLNDLFRDMEKASRSNGSHYLSAFHLVKLDIDALSDPQSSSFGDFLDIEHNSELNKLRALASQRSATNALGQKLAVYAVVDGQQRLTTLYMLAHMYATVCNPDTFSGLYVRLRDGSELPRLIQHPHDDHKFLKRLLENLRKSQPLGDGTSPSQSQKRMLYNAERIRTWAKCNNNRGALQFFDSDDFKTSVIVLEPKFGLTSFMILNDRGKPLTVLEKFKSLLLEFAFDARAHDDAKAHEVIRRLHTVFGALYLALDACITSGLFSQGSNGDAHDAQLMQLISCYLRMDKDRESLYQAGETAYEAYFRPTLHNTPVSGVLDLINDWTDGIKELATQLTALNQYLSKAKDIGGGPSIHFGESSLLWVDYRGTLLSLGLQPHLLALLLKFRSMYPSYDWHQQFPVPAYGDPQRVIQPILDLIENVRNRAQERQGIPQVLFDYLNTLRDDLNTLQLENWYPHNKLSMLEVVERMQLFNWNLDHRWYQTFIGWCRATLSTQRTAGLFVAKWGEWCSAVDFIKDVLTGHTQSNFRFLLKEYERHFGNNLHDEAPTDEAPEQRLELEHVFAQNIDTDPQFNALGGFRSFDFADRDDFNQNMLWRSGNLMWLSKSANAHLGNQIPDIKASHYRDCPGHPSGSGKNVCSNIEIVKRLGEQLGALGTTYPAYRLQLEARCAELAIFALKRFGG